VYEKSQMNCFLIYINAEELSRILFYKFNSQLRKAAQRAAKYMALARRERLPGEKQNYFFK